MTKPRTPPARVNRKRAAKRKAEAFGEGKAAFVRSLPCVVGIFCVGAMEASHIRSRGAGGKASDLVSMCQKHHRIFHDMGRATFQRYHELNLTELAARVEMDWQAQQPSTLDSIRK